MYTAIRVSELINIRLTGIDDALIQPYSGHESRKSLEVYSKLAITEAQNKYNEVINKLPI